MERLSVGKLPQISADDVAAHIWKHTHTHTFNGPLSRTTWVSQYQKGKTNLNFTGSGISWAMCKYAPRSRQITMPAPHHSVFFTGRMPSGVLPKMEVGICKGARQRDWRYPAYLWSLRWVYAVKKNPGGWYTLYTRVYPPIHHCGCPSCRPTNSVKAPENKTENTTKKQATMSDKTTVTSISIGFYISHLAKCDRNIDTHTQPFNSTLSGTSATQVSWYQKKHSPTHI